MSEDTALVLLGLGMAGSGLMGAAIGSVIIRRERRAYREFIEALRKAHEDRS